MTVRPTSRPQRYGAEIGNREVLLAINRLVDRYTDRLTEARRSAPGFEALDLGAFRPRQTGPQIGDVNGAGAKANGHGTSGLRHEAPFDIREAG